MDDISPNWPRRLLRWYDANRRLLPWRETRDPYRIWISEIMLQQTRVDTVLPYYRRFLQRFPDVEALAAAEIDEVLALWSGLGYYRRARQMHAAARQVVAGGGRFPESEEGLRELPGIGPYTAAAVASIAFGVVAPVLDGNVERVLARMLAMEEDPKSVASRRRLLAAAAEWLDRRRPGDGNQALMELGATVCTPARPDCPACPVSGACRAFERGDPEHYPPPRRRRQPVRERRVVVVVEREGRVLLFRRPDSRRLLAGTWELPWVENAAGGAAAALAERYGGRWRLGPEVGEARHAITYRRITLEVRRGRVMGGESVAEGPEAGWFTGEEIAALPTSSIVRKVLAMLARE